MIRVLIADDHALARSGLSAMLGVQPDIEVVGTAADGVEAVAEARRLRPDLVLMDIRMPRLDGIEATRRIRGGSGGPAVLVLTTSISTSTCTRRCARVRVAFLLKDAPPGQLAEAVRTVAAGQALLAPAVTRRLIERFLNVPPGGGTALERLTDREREVLSHVGEAGRTRRSPPIMPNSPIWAGSARRCAVTCSTAGPPSNRSPHVAHSSSNG